MLTKLLGLALMALAAVGAGNAQEKNIVDTAVPGPLEQTP